ncbi:MAG: hypothetical protein J5781_04760 [Clostridia bacterium]|nr:hypothetical protein [Clostridia bacterium]
MKKRIIIITVLICVAIIACVCTLAFWRPYTIEDGERVILHCSEKAIELTPEDKDFAVTQKMIEKTLNSARFSAFYAKEQVKMQCSDENVVSYKETNDIWIEIISDTGEYRKLFFVLKNGEDKQFIRVFATEADSYDGGKFLVYNNCDCKDIIDYLQRL